MRFDQKTLMRSWNMRMIEILTFTALYVFLLAITSVIHYKMGYQTGVSNTVESIRQFEPQAVENAIRKIKSHADAKFR